MEGGSPNPNDKYIYRSYNELGKGLCSLKGLVILRSLALNRGLMIIRRSLMSWPQPPFASDSGVRYSPERGQMRRLENIASAVVRFGSFWRNLGYDSGLLRTRRPPLPTISVGNISFGGAGKTPLAIFLLGFLKEKGWAPCFISRGYRGQWEKSGGVVGDGQHLLASWKQAGDEPYMVAIKSPSTPVIVGRNRYLSCLKAVELGCNIAVLDDAFQHRRLARDLDIVLVSPEERPQRESWRSLRRAHIVLVRKGLNAGDEAAQKMKKRLKKYIGEQSGVFAYDLVPDSVFFLNDKKTTAPEFLKGQKIVAFCGLAAPQNFRLTLEKIGASLAAFFSFPDHYPYPEKCLQKIIRQINQVKPDLVVTTEKDAVKLLDHEWFPKEIPVGVLQIRFTAEKAFSEALEKFLESLKAQKTEQVSAAGGLDHQQKGSSQP